MNLLILNGVHSKRPGANLLYRGTDRNAASYCKEQPAESEVNQLFLWYLDEGGQGGVVHDLSKALRYADLLNMHDGSTKYEVIEVVESDRPATSGGIFAGYDISTGAGNSLLRWGLRLFMGGRVSPAIQDLLDLLYRHYSPHLNGQGLFQTSEIASLCLRSMKALQHFQHGLFEGSDLSEFDVFGIYVCKPGSLQAPLSSPADDKGSHVH